MSDKNTDPTQTSPAADSTVLGQELKVRTEQVQKPVQTLTAAVAAAATEVQPAPAVENVAPTTTPPTDPKVAVLRDRVAALLTGAGDKRMASINYVSVMSTKFMTPNLINQGANLLWQATKIVIENPHPAIIDVMWDFHVKYRDSLMSQTHGLRGIQSLQYDANLKTSIVHTLFHTHAGVPWATRRNTRQPDTATIVTLLGDDRLYSYIVNKRDVVGK